MDRTGMMTLDRIFGVAGLRVLIVGATPIGVASQTMFEALGAKAELADIVPDEAAIVETVAAFTGRHGGVDLRSEEHTSELQSLMRISYAVFCLTKKKPNTHPDNTKISPTS